MSVRMPYRSADIIDAVLQTCHVEPVDVMGKSRHPRVVAFRAIATLLMRKHTAMSYPEIARDIYRPNHSTVITAHYRLLYQIEHPDAHGARVELTDGNSYAVIDLIDSAERLLAQLHTKRRRREAALSTQTSQPPASPQTTVPSVSSERPMPLPYLGE